MADPPGEPHTKFGEGFLTPVDAVLARAQSHRGAPYFFGADGPDAFDCNGLLFDAFRRNGVADVYPWPERREAQDFWALLPRVAWEERRAADVVCFGDAGGCHHVVLVVNGDWLIGANHGGPPRAGEIDADYRARMAAADGGLGARVCVVPSSYWASARLGVVRVPALTSGPSSIASTSPSSAPHLACDPRGARDGGSVSSECPRGKMS